MSAIAARPHGATLARAGRPRPERCAHAGDEERPGGVDATEPRAVIAAVAEVVDAAAGRAAVGGRGGTRVASGGIGRLVAEQVLEAAAPLLEPDQRQAEVDDAVATRS